MTDQTTETARALLYRHGLPEDVIDGALCLHAQELAAVQRRDAAVWGVDTAAGKRVLATADLIDPTRGAAPTVPLPSVDQSPIREQLLDAIDFSFCQSLGFGTPEGLLAAYEASRTQTVDDSTLEALSDTLYDALYAITPFAEKYFADEGEGLRGAVRAVLEQAAALPATPGRAEYDALVAEADRLRREGAALHARAEGIDKQMAALQKQVAAPVDRAAVLRDGADELDARMARFFIEWPDEPRNSPYALGQKDAANELRRVADETAATETQAAAWGVCQDCGAAAGPDCDCPPFAEQQAAPVQHAPGKVICCADCRAKGYTVCLDEPAAEVWRGATEVISDREVERLAATGLVGYRQGRGRLLHCLHHKPVPASRWADFHEVTADDLSDGGICVHPRCGADLLAVAGARQDGAQ